MKFKINIKIAVIIFLCILIASLFFIPKEYLRPIITGRVITRVSVISRVALNCSIFMVEGWNLVSMPCVTKNNSRDPMLTTINDSYLSIHTYKITDTLDPWKSYNPNLPWWVVQDLDKITELEGYWIRMSYNDTWLVDGKVIWPILIPMFRGWNLVGFHSNVTMRMNDSLQTIDGSYSAVYAYNANTSQWMIYYPWLPPWVSQNLTNMSLYFGYWINMTQDDVWVLGT